jgi:S-adenosylmethionine:tRNA ribosyltransferase-isomerase
MPSINDYDYDLPEELIAQEPAPERDQARMLVLQRQGQTLTHSRFAELPQWLEPGEVVVINDTRVFPARLRGQKASGGRVEVLLVELPPQAAEGAGVRQGTARALWRAAKPPRPGQEVKFGPSLRAEVIAVAGGGLVDLRLDSREADLLTELTRSGEVPLPPYIRRPPRGDDRHRYQTVYAQHLGAVAAPTAGLHFTPQVLDALAAKGVAIVPLTLHVGPGTFQPVRHEDYRQHRLAPEYFLLSPQSAAAINAAKAAGRRLVAVGTTCVRVLEGQYRQGAVQPGSGWCDLFIQPGHRFQVVDRLLTNFHLPKTTLLLLVSAFAGREFVLQAYATAVAHRYRFYSYGDCMLIL